MSDDGFEDIEVELGFELVATSNLPSGRLQDIMLKLNARDISVLSLDSLIYNDSTIGNPSKLAFALRVLQTFLYNIKPSVKTLSLRFNNFPLDAQDYMIEWVEQNNCMIDIDKISRVDSIILMRVYFRIFVGVEVLYLQGSGFDAKKKDLLKAAWRKNLSSHRTDNFEQTLIRVYIDPNAPPTEDV